MQTRETTEAIEAEIERQREAVREKKRRNAPPLVDEKKLQKFDRVIVSFLVPEDGRAYFRARNPLFVLMILFRCIFQVNVAMVCIGSMIPMNKGRGLS